MLEGTRKICISESSISERIGSLYASNDRRLMTKDNIEACIKGYLKRADNAILPISEIKCRESFDKYLKLAFVGLLFKDGFELPVGFIIAIPGNSDVSKAKFMQQVFYNSELDGISAAKAVWVLHRLLIKYSEIYKYTYVLSVCSPQDTDFTFNKILSKDGWLSTGHTSVYKI